MSEKIKCRVKLQTEIEVDVELTPAGTTTSVHLSPDQIKGVTASLQNVAGEQLALFLPANSPPDEVVQLKEQIHEILRMGIVTALDALSGHVKKSMRNLPTEVTSIGDIDTPIARA